MLDPGLLFLFGFIGFCLVLLLVINIISRKYLNGDYVKVDDVAEEEDDIEDSDDENVSKNKENLKAAPYWERSADELLSKNCGVVTLSLRYYQQTQTVEGVIKQLSNISSSSTLRARFTAWPTTNKKKIGKTTWEKIENMATTSFSIKPVVIEEMLTSSLYLRLQTKENIKSKKRHGECYISLNEIVGKVDGVEFTRNLLPVSVFFENVT